MIARVAAGTTLALTLSLGTAGSESRERAPADERLPVASADSVLVAPGGRIQDALDSCTCTVELAADTTYPVSEPLRLGDLDRLVGHGKSSVVQASRPMRAVIQLGDRSGSSPWSVDAAAVMSLTIDAAEHAEAGLQVDPDQRSDYSQGEPDPVTRLRDLWVYDAASVGVYVGPYARATTIDTVRVRRAGLHGFALRMADSFVTNSEATTRHRTGTPFDPELPEVGSGFLIASVNTTYNGIKAWYSRGYGIHVRGTRNQLTNVQSQDTALHGVYVEYDKNILTSIQADSAGMADVGGKPGTADGIYIEGAGSTVASGLLGFDRQPRGASASQRCGINLTRELLDSGQVTALGGYGNLVAPVCVDGQPAPS